jgi:PhzF family phenazine biosynthesis protein
MTELRIVQVDAFADLPFTGNPAAVMPLDAWLPDETLQAIAAENNLAETAFTIRAEGDADYELRWFSPTVEIEFCGHATLASGHVLMGGAGSVRFRTRWSGIMIVSRDSAAGLDSLLLNVKPIPVAPAARPELLEALGTPDGQVFVSSEDAQATAIILLPDAAAVRACSPDMKTLGAIEVMAVATAPGDGEHDVVSRVFVPAWGVDEDPVTGSAHAALTPFWCDRLGRDSFSAFQASKRGGAVACRLAGDRVILGGRCVTVMEGVMRI